MIETRDLCLELPGFSLRDVNLRIGDREHFILVGPTGSGKTLLLETIAGLRTVTSGEVWVDGRNVTRVEPEKRGIGMVYQDCALFPHLSVADNIAFGLRVRHAPAAEVNAELGRLAGLLGIRDLFDKRPGVLSGGEKQKVALARALATRPKALLLDEPLSALDPRTRETVRREIARLHGELGIITLHVTHDFDEAVTMGSRIAVIGGGRVRQVGTPDEIFRHPNSEFVARFTMAVNILPGRARRDGSGETVFTTGGISLAAGGDGEGDCFAAIRPENILVSRPVAGDEGCNVLRGTIAGIAIKGSTVDVSVDVPPALTCLLTRRTFDELGLEVGQQVHLAVPRLAVSLFPR